ncbi:uncharacterized protein [Zea mays]|nr:uncharacterized protein LOC103647983 isoform X1 [Zea mays]|eukprot:XP_020404242.1 uncharacterized protein LOC103647983 isoform X1 [Zea mays]
MASHSPFMFHLYIKARSVPILSAIKNRYYKVTDGALRACGEVVRVLCPILEVILYSMSCGHEVPCCLIFIFFNFVVQTTSVVFRPYNSMWSITTCFGIDFKKTKNKCINMRKKLKKRILGVEESASQQEIEKVYHKLALRLHPDTNPGNEPKRSFSGCRRLYPFLEIQRKELYMMRLTSVMTIQSSGVLPNNVQKAAFLFFYIKPTENDKKLRKFFPEEKGPISNIDPIEVEAAELSACLFSHIGSSASNLVSVSRRSIMVHMEAVGTSPRDGQFEDPMSAAEEAAFCNPVSAAEEVAFCNAFTRVLKPKMEE